MANVNQIFNKYLTWIVIGVALAAFVFDQSFVWASNYTTLFLQIIMFFMGLTLSVSDFKEVFHRPAYVAMVSLMQFIWMPFAGWALTKLFNLPPELALGVILLGCCPGGTASNVMTYLSNGDVALSVTATSISTMLAPIIMPLNISLYAGEIIEISFWPMFWSILRVVFLPVVFGVIVNSLFGKKIASYYFVLPTFSSIGVLLVIAAVVSVNKETIMHSGLLIAFVTFLHNSSGYAFAWGVCKLLKVDVASTRAMQIEVGMQNSGLASSMALNAPFNAPQASMAGAIYSIMHNVTGSLFASYCRYKDAKSAESSPAAVETPVTEA